MQFRVLHLRNRKIFIVSFLGFAFLLLVLFYLINPGKSKADGYTLPVEDAFSAYISAYTVGVISSESPIQVRFTVDVAQENQLGLEHEAKVFETDPAIEGKAFWVDSRTLSFQPAKPLKSGALYQVKLKLNKLMEVPKEAEVFSFSVKTMEQNFEVRVEGMRPYDKKDLKKQKFLGMVQTADVANPDAIEATLSALQGGKKLVTSWQHGDAEGELLGAQIAPDGQWRFPAAEAVPAKFEKALLQFEDRYFYHHPGFNPVAMAKALIDNVKAGKVVRGGSTISMQVVRLARQGQGRTYAEKALELLMALKLELFYSKAEILQLYATHAPFGGNTVGLQAACWRYYNRPGAELSWAEAATLAVLPNAPALILPGKNQQLLLQKRNRLLKALLEAGEIDQTTYQLALDEPLPGSPYPFPTTTRHLLLRTLKDGRQGKLTQTTIRNELQEQVASLVALHHDRLSGNQVHNAAVLVLDTETGNTLAYIGNTGSIIDTERGNDVDVITAPRSTGSILKPFLYAAALNEGRLLPHSLLPDVPFYQKGFNPQNFNKTFEGAVPAHKALARSLNIPYVYLLQEYGVERFHYLLKKMGMQTLPRGPGHYGLSLILGGAEGSLWDITGMYASMARTLTHYSSYRQNYSPEDYHAATYIAWEAKEARLENTSPLKAAALWHMFDALQEVNRPDTEGAWKQFSSSRRVAWKTGTSFGFRDGWAIGVTPEYTVGVWVGNASGEGRPGLTGIEAAAPLLFDVFSALPATSWFSEPGGDLVPVLICKQSGHKASDQCPDPFMQGVPDAGLTSAPCPYHQLVHLDAAGQYRVTSQCEPIGQMQHQPWFVLPPIMEWFYKSRNPQYAALPPVKSGCEAYSQQSMQLIYPAKAAKIVVPRELDGSGGRTVFEVARRQPGTTLYWHLDEQYLGATNSLHQMALNPAEGPHLLLVTDENGESLEHRFEVLAGVR